VSTPEVTPQRPIILASGSEIRKQMLGDAGIVFSVQASELNESKLKKISEEEPFQDWVIKLASAKAKVISKKNKDCYVIGSDQMCVYKDKLLNKPGNFENAVKHLSLLSGNTHYQYSGVCISLNGESVWSFSDKASLTMHNLSEEEIVSYVKADEPYQCSGSYKYESLGVNLFSKVEGSSETIQGLVLTPLLKALRELGTIP
jgi:septum formation protein